MKHIILTVLIGVLFLSAVHSQTDTSFFDANWQLTTRIKAHFYRPAPKKDESGFMVRDYYMSGVKQMEGISINNTTDVFDGKITWYFESGKISQEANYNKGVNDGLFITYDEKGNVTSKGTYQDGQPQDGSFYADFKTYKVSAYYTNGILQKHEIFDNSTFGKAHYEIFYNDDQTYKNLVYYNNDGSLIGKAEKLNPENGILEGLEVLYNQNPMTVASVANVSDGKYVGVKKYFFSNGKTKLLEYYNKLNEKTKEVYFNTKTKAIDSLIYKDYYAYKGKQYTYFDASDVPFEYDKVKSIASYKNGELISEKKFFPNGRPSFIKTPEDGETTYDSIGTIISHLIYKEGAPFQGKKITQNEGVISFEEEYNNGKVINDISYENGVPLARNEYNAEGQNIKKITFYSNGKTSSETTFENGQETENRYFSPDGQLLGKLTIDKNYNRNGDMYNIDQDKITSIITYQANIASRTRQYYNGQLVNDTYQNGQSVYNDLANGKSYTCATKDGMPYTGTQVEYNSYNFTIDKLIHYKEGKLDGEYITYEESAYDEDNDNNTTKLRHIARKTNYLGGKKNGLDEEFSEDKLIKSASFKNDIQQGETKFYSKDGKLLSTVIYKDGIPMNGKVYSYDYKYISSVSTYKNGKQNGETIIYNDDQIESVQTFIDDQLTKKIAYSDSKPTYTITYKDGDPFEGIEMDDDNLKEYKKGQLVKETTYTDSDHKTITQVSTCDGEICQTKKFFANNNIKATLTYQNSQPDGDAQFYNISGKVIANGTYAKGEPLTGSFIFYHTSDETSFVQLTINDDFVEFTEYINDIPGHRIQFAKFDTKNDSTNIQSLINLVNQMFVEYSYE